MTTVVISQPMFFPWVGMWEQIRLADIYVHYDDVQFSKGSFTNRVQIKTAQGCQWLSVPLQNVKLGQAIRDTEVSSKEDWRRKHLDTLGQAYARAPFQSEMVELVKRVYAHEARTISEVAIASMEMTARYLDIGQPDQWHFASSLPIEGSSSQRVLDIVKYFGGTRYVTGHGAARYLDHELFERNGVAVEYMQYELRPYPQAHGDFTPYVSILDLVANCGRSGSHVIASGTVGWRAFMDARAASETTPESRPVSLPSIEPSI